MTLDDFFGDHDDSRRLFEAVRVCLESIGDAEIRVSKSQVGFYRRTGFASVWMPGQYLGETDVPLVLTVALRRRDTSPRWKQVVEPAPGRFTHHLELRSDAEVDAEVRDWIAEAWMLAE
ncbi:MAG: DUF5655 domain-containing protein [Coriobacteriia bacterium]